jgi:cyclic pyranopterin phosphate synthase
VSGGPALVDSFGRVVRDLRISVTDRCNFRCTYCMPPEGLDWMPRSKLLTFEEITRLARVFVEHGVRSVKITGGEPLVRRDLPRLIEMLRALDEDLDISLTTNGYLLGGLAQPLADAGLDRVSVSCDSLLRHRFAELTLRDVLDEVRSGLRVAAAAGLTPIKVNVVLMRGRNDDEVLDFARLARETGFGIRFIEYMPLDAQGAWRADDVVPAREILDSIAAEFPLLPAAGEGPARTYAFADGSAGSIGVIPSVTEPFCESCDRVRLTADGGLLSCLFAQSETDLRTPLRAGAEDGEIEALIRDCVAAKWAGHRIGQADFVRSARSMSMIGG